MHVRLVDAHFIVVSIPAIRTRPEERELHRRFLIAGNGNISKFDSESSRG